MAKRIKRIKKGAQSLKEEIEKHFLKLEKDLENDNIDLGRYHVKELERGLIKALEIKIEILNKDDDSVLKFKERLDMLKNKFEIT
ncbi:hypothetical protein COU57_00640 [Candidatus Pacearchaeota archaeon CG10_big_fil_rev_8_21_14_0_10_32_14]|nr:MAG: hypothetical protein COU57_00640 [Candidatus Pacearchaeota archaeon CG10_big_fil_rev_8_21_14_0_10_32_14]